MTEANDVLQNAIISNMSLKREFLKIKLPNYYNGVKVVSPEKLGEIALNKDIVIKLPIVSVNNDIKKKQNTLN